MRMWNVTPQLMCRQHLLGEHVEMHMFTGVIRQGKSIQGYLDNQLVEVDKINERHNQLLKEMIKRGYKHNSKISNLKLPSIGFVDEKLNLEILRQRCKECRRLQDGA